MLSTRQMKHAPGPPTTVPLLFERVPSHGRSFFRSFGVFRCRTSKPLSSACPLRPRYPWMAERQEQHTGAHKRAEQPQAPRAHQGLRSALQHVRKAVADGNVEHSLARVRNMLNARATCTSFECLFHWVARANPPPSVSWCFKAIVVRVSCHDRKRRRFYYGHVRRFGRSV